MDYRILEDISKWSIEQRIDALKTIYKERMGIELDIENPKRFSEKCQKLKLFCNDPLMTKCVNKLTFKQYVREKLGNGYTAELIDVWHSPVDVNIRDVPEKCVIKSNCSKEGECLYIIKDKKKIDIEKLENEIRERWFDWRLLNTNSFNCMYYDVKPCVLVEEYIEECDRDADEYKVMCFGGIPQYIYKVEGHFTNGQNNIGRYAVSFFTKEWKYIDVQVGKHENNPNATKPVNIQKMLEISEILSKDFPFVRIDFFETDSGLKLSELTFVPNSGLKKYYPDSFDLEMGRLWK